MSRAAKYTDEQRDAALDIYTHSGPRAAMRATGVPATTICRWAQQAGIAGRAGEKTQERDKGRQRAWIERRADVINKLGDLVDTLIDATTKAAAGDDLKEARYGAIALGTVIDKAQLLSGGATDRPDYMLLSPDDLAAQLREERDHLAQVINLPDRKAMGE